MIAAAFDRVVAETLGERLLAAGWKALARSSWTKQDSSGSSRLAIDPRRQFSQFRVLLCWDPKDMSALVGDLFREELPVESRGFLCGPYLSPARVSRSPHHWPSRTKLDLLQSIPEVWEAFKQVGEPWLEGLRDPLTFAQQADPVAALVAGFAWERAGQMERAHSSYGEMLRRIESALAIKSRAPLPASMKRQYLFLCERLGRVDPLVGQFRSELESTGGTTRQ